MVSTCPIVPVIRRVGRTGRYKRNLWKSGHKMVETDAEDDHNNSP